MEENKINLNIYEQILELLTIQSKTKSFVPNSALVTKANFFPTARSFVADATFIEGDYRD